MKDDILNKLAKACALELAEKDEWETAGLGRDEVPRLMKSFKKAMKKALTEIEISVSIESRSTIK